MKSVRLVSYVIFAGLMLFQNLSPGITDAVELRLGDQSVFLYGDEHNTHEIDEGRERQAIDAFCRELKSINKHTLVLCEDQKMPPFSTICSDEAPKLLFYDSWNKAFMQVVCRFAHTISKPGSYVQAQSIDPRSELVDLVGMALKYLSKNLNQNYVQTTNQRQRLIYDLEKNVYDAVKNGSISGVFELLITNIKLFSEFTSNNKAKIIFDNIAETLQLRKMVLWKKIIADTGLSKDELDQATIKMVGERMRTDSRYERLIDFLTDENLMIEYSSESVDADALWHIAGKHNPCKKIVVIAGAAHIYSLEKHLLTLGFEQNHSVGQDYARAWKNDHSARLYADNVVDPDHKLRVWPLDPLDEFGNNLFKAEISAAWEKINDLAEASCSHEVNEAIRDCNTKTNIFESYTSAPLVPFEAFAWINENGKKRKRSLRKESMNKKRKISK